MQNLIITKLAVVKTASLDFWLPFTIAIRLRNKTPKSCGIIVGGIENYDIFAITYMAS